MDLKIKNTIKGQIERILNLGFSFRITETKIAENDFIEEVILEKEPIRIEISYNTLIDCKLVSLYISRTDKNSSFSFEEYLLYKSKDKKICRGATSDDDETYIKDFFKLFYKAIDDDLYDVLIGKTWIDVPPDWNSIPGK